MRILTTLDGSTESNQVLPVVKELAEALDATVVLLMVCEPGPGVPRRGAQPIQVATITGPGGLTSTNPLDIAEFTEARTAYWVESKEQALERTEAEAHDYLRDIAVTFDSCGIGVETRVIIGDSAASAIIGAATKERADVVAMATHGWSGFRNVVQGSVAAQVLKSGVSPVLLVRSSADRN